MASEETYRKAEAAVDAIGEWTTFTAGDGRPAIRMFESDERTRAMARAAVDAVADDLIAEGGPVRRDITITLNNHSACYSTTDQAIFKAALRRQPWVLSTQVPDGRWQAIKARLKQHKGLRWLKVRTKWEPIWEGRVNVRNAAAEHIADRIRDLLDDDLQGDEQRRALLDALEVAEEALPKEVHSG